MKIQTLLFCFALFSFPAVAAEDVTGVWKTIDDETGEAKSLVAIYRYREKVYGRVVKLFKNPDATAAGIVGNPKIDGLDIVWDMQDTGERWTGGRVLDPKKGKIYKCEIWKENGNLILRGKIGPFGRNQTWVKAEETVKTDSFVPQIPQKE